MAALDLDAYRRDAEAFLAAIDREYLLHLAGHKRELEVAAIYARHPDLFGAESVARLRGLAESASGDERRRLRYLAHFALDGAIGAATKAEAEEAARLEATLELELEGERMPYRQVAVAQANEPDPARRAELETARNALLAGRINPLHRHALEAAHELCRELGWASYARAYGELRGLDLEALRAQTNRLLAATEELYGATLAAEIERSGLPPLGELRRADVPRLMRAPALDELEGGFPEERLLGSFAQTLAGLGLDLASQENIRVDAEARPSKSPRAFCSTPSVPGEVHLVVAPVGGREDYAALFHEGGHAEHYANVDPELAFEFRHLGDNGVTESFAFLFEHLTDDPDWLAARLGIGDSEPVCRHAGAVRLLFIRRYCAKLAYELELHGESPRLAELPRLYSERLAAATGVAWPQETFLADVDEGFYVACYLRAWALERHWRRALRERFGERWFERAEAGDWLRGLWASGQRLTAEELLGDVLGEELDFGLLAAAAT